MKTLILTEKPKVSQRIAWVLSPKYKKKWEKGVPYFEIKINGDELYVASAAGHLYTLEQKEKGWSYPVFDIQWVPSYKVDKNKGYISRYIQLLSLLAKKVDEFYLATDWDIEGELLGFNALRFSCKTNKAKRMRFSTLTKNELIKAFENPSEVDLALVDSGEVRHIMDWYWGINTSRALTQALKKVSGRFSTISAGRVQTPALALLVHRDREIQAFKPEKYWEVFADLDVKGKEIKAQHEEGKISDRKRAGEIIERSENKEAKVRETNKERTRNIAPPPFDLGTLQSEAYRIFKFVPKMTQTLAQNLYESGCISYPRTSSQKLPYGIGFKRIIEKLGSLEKFNKPAQILLEKEKLKPRQGKKTDPAHPAIYPTGVVPKKLSRDEEKLYALIVHRFFAVFGDPMIREKIGVKVIIGDEIFVFKAESTIEKGWSELYPYIKFSEIIIPRLDVREVLKVLKVYSLEKETQPPKRYNPASLVKELENRELGTKATRADIVDTLYRRRFIEDRIIRVTEIGFSVIDALEEYVPEIVSEKLTRRFQDKIEGIQKGKESKERVLEEAKSELAKILETFKEKEEEIGERISDAIKQSEKKKTLGKCNLCDGELKIIKARKGGEFIGCSNYPECKNIFSLFTSYGVEPTDKKCPECGLPVISTSKGKYLSCINPKCKSNEKRYVVGKCPKCEGDLRIMKVRKQFIGCSNHPNCRVSYPLPQKVGILPANKKCSECGLPTISIPFGKRRLLGCIDMNCKSKKNKKSEDK